MNNNKNKQQLHLHSNASRVRSLGLVDMALPLTVASPPQLRHRRHFQFNGMHFEANPLSLQLPRSAQDGDAGDARYSTTITSEQRRDPSSFPFKALLRGGDNISGTESQQHGVLWRAENNNDNDYDNDMAGGEDVYSGGGGRSHERVHHTLPNYSRFPSEDEYNKNNNNNNYYKNNSNNISNSNSSNNNVSNNYSTYKKNNLSCNNSYCETEDNNIKNDDNNGLEQRPILTGSTPTHKSMQVKAAAVSDSKMDYITLAGFLLGYLTSNVLFFLCWYFSWLKGQVMKLRKHFLGQSNLWEFFDFEDTTRYSMQTKLILAPLILICSILYCVVNILHLMIKLVRSDVPRTVVDIVHRIAKNYWP
ncbi:GATA zinc finger domain-containing protein 16 [Drosophila innubila]|uniref:GATA zinc finger domain-containing protein 16 n=1 Tax=Drosophila innubila TaxID=198719 RepID=UPI00148B8B83|nr:GATA zinc finger domain-containing protein 16 [Drosophila innubila]